LLDRLRGDGAPLENLDDGTHGAGIFSELLACTHDVGVRLGELRLERLHELPVRLRLRLLLHLSELVTLRRVRLEHGCHLRFGALLVWAVRDIWHARACELGGEAIACGAIGTERFERRCCVLHRPLSRLDGEAFEFRELKGAGAEHG